jgi:hypothetical protein
MAPSSQGLEPPDYPARFTIGIFAVFIALGGIFLERGMASGVPASPNLQKTVQRFANELGDSLPARAEYVQTTRSQANGLIGATVDSNESVYLVVLQGKFSISSARVPPGQPSPSGSNAVSVIDGHTGKVVDFGVTEQSVYQGLASLGTVRQVFGWNAPGQLT